MARDAAYWSRRRKRQFVRMGGKALAAYQRPSVGSIAKAAWSGVKYLRTLVNSEVHKHDVAPTSQAIGTTATIIQLNAIAQGDTVSSRTGNSILAKYLAVKMSLAIHGSATNTVVRLIIFIDHQQIADTAPGTTDLLNSNSTLAHIQTNTVGRFEVIKDWFITLDSASRASFTTQLYKNFAGRTQRGRYYDSGTGLHCKFNGTGSTDIQSNGIYFLMLSSEATNTPTLTYSARFGFHDN